MLLLLQWMLDRGERSSCSGCGSSLRRNPLAGVCQKALCLGNGAPDDVFGRWDVLNEGDGFSGNHRRGIEVAGLASALELGNDVLTPHQLQLAAEPSLCVRVRQAASRKGVRPHVVAGDIEDDATPRSCPESAHDALLCPIPPGGLPPRKKARPHDAAWRAQHDACSQPPPISSTASKQNWNFVADRIHDRRDERERALR